MQKYIFKLILTAVSALFIAGCASSGQKEAVSTADTFMDAFYHAHYAEAAEVSGERLATVIRESREMVESLPDSIRTVFQELSSQVEVNRKEVSYFQKDSAVVLYEIFVPENIDLLSNHVVLLKDATQDRWLVSDVTE